MTDEEYVAKLTDFIGDSFRRHFGDQLKKCTDCGGMRVDMCEKAFRQTIAMVARRTLKDMKDPPKAGDEMMPMSPIQL